MKQVETARSGTPPGLVALQSLNDASKSRDVYTADRQQGSKRVGKLAQEFTNAFSDFVSAYSGIVDIVKGAGGIYATAAYQTLSIFLIVSQRKYHTSSSYL